MLMPKSRGPAATVKKPNVLRNAAGMQWEQKSPTYCGDGVKAEAVMHAHGSRPQRHEGRLCEVMGHVREDGGSRGVPSFRSPRFVRNPNGA